VPGRVLREFMSVVVEMKPVEHSSVPFSIAGVVSRKYPDEVHELQARELVVGVGEVRT